MPELPKLDSRTIRQCICAIEKCDFTITASAELDAVVWRLIAGYKVSAPKLTQPIDLYRARICDKPMYIKELGPPPTSCIGKYGRANEPGESVFYCSTSRRAPFFELQCKPGDHIAMSLWRNNSELVLNHIGFTEELKERLGSNRNLNEIYKFVVDTNNFGNLNEMVHEYLGFIFAKPLGDDIRSDYFKFTSAIARVMMQGEVINGLMYPTIQMTGNADNIVLKHDYYNEHIEFVNAEYIRIDSQKGMKYGITILDSATQIGESGELRWSGRPLHWELTPKQVVQMKVHDGRWIAENLNGNRVDPI